MYVVFFARTGTARKFESYNLAQANYPNMPILAQPRDIPADYAITWYELLFEWVDSAGTFKHGTDRVTYIPNASIHPKPRVVETKTPSYAQEAFWKLAVAAASPVSVHNQGGKRGKSPSSYAVDLPRANSVLASQEKMPAQAKAIIQFLVEQEFDFYTKEEMQKLCNHYRFIAAMKTQQDPWRIFRYYRPLLQSLGVLK